MTGPLVGISDSIGVSGVLGENAVGGSIKPSPVNAGGLGVSAGGPGVKGVSHSEINPFEENQSSFGVAGGSGDGLADANGAAAVGSGAPANPGVLGVSDAGPGVMGASDSNVGVAGQSQSESGVSGTTVSGQAAVYGSSAGRPGVTGESTSNFGVYGSSVQKYGVYGISTAVGGAGVLGENSFVGSGVTYSPVGAGVAGQGIFAQAIIGEEIHQNRFTIRTDKPGVRVYWQVAGVRCDPFAQASPVIVERDKSERERGRYLSPVAYEKPRGMGIRLPARSRREGGLESMLGRIRRRPAYRPSPPPVK